MQFENQKKTVLGKIDKSKKGSFDKGILPLIDKINKSSHYYTTSSCSGRTVLVAKKPGGKEGAEWVFAKHSKANFKEVKDSLEGLPGSDIYFKFEPFIMHVACKTIEDAQSIVNKAREAGFRRSGIQATKARVIVELASTDILETIIAKKGELLVGDDYLKVLISDAGSKMKRNKEKIKKFYDMF